MHALVIEDDAIIALLIKDELRELGFRSVDLASTEEEAVKSVAQRRPDLVTADRSLLAHTGGRVLRQIRSSLAVPVVFITGDPDRAEECLPGAPVLEKPFSLAQLSAVIARVRPSAQRGR